MAAKALDLPTAVGPTALLAFVPAVLIAQVLPISISGLGVREGLFVLFLHPLGVPQSQAIALGLLLYLLNLVVSLFGAPAFAVGHRVRPSAPCTMTRPATTTTRLRGQAHRPSEGLKWWHEVLLAGVFYFVYSQVRNSFGAGPESRAIAFGHARDVIRIEEALHLWIEPRAAVAGTSTCPPTASSGSGTSTTAPPTSS